MSTEIEREFTYLAKALPEGLDESPSKIIADHYIPAEAEHPVMRVRRKGDSYEITKKQPVSGTDSSRQTEETIALTEAEYKGLLTAEGKGFVKRRYFVKIDGYDAEVDVYLENLEGLVVIDFEFENDEDMQEFVVPEVCLADVTQEKFIAGGILAGKKYTDLETELDKFNYHKIDVGALR